jgi:predicted RNase H-like HicB family nuclease
MNIPVFVEPVANNGYHASSGAVPGVSAEGPTADDALRQFQAAVAGRLAAGARLVSVPVAAGDNPWLRLAGMCEDDALFDEWQQAIAERRRRLDADPDVP